MITTRNFIIIVGLCLFLTAIVLQAASADQSSVYYNDPQSIIAEVKSRGAEVVVAELYSDWNVWYSILRKISTGENYWLKAAVALFPGTATGTFNMLTKTVGEALEHNPENVLRIASYNIGLPFFCNGPDIDDKRYGTYELAINAINKRQKKVASIANPELKELCDRCIRSLETSKANMARFYGVNTQ